jgi:hypothetical protein
VICCDRALHGVGLADHGELRQGRQQARYFGARRRFIVDDEDGVTQNAAGKLKVARVPRGWRGAARSYAYPETAAADAVEHSKARFPASRAVHRFPTPSSLTE